MSAMPEVALYTVETVPVREYLGAVTFWARDDSLDTAEAHAVAGAINRKRNAADSWLQQGALPVGRCLEGWVEKRGKEWKIVHWHTSAPRRPATPPPPKP